MYNFLLIYLIINKLNTEHIVILGILNIIIKNNRKEI